jgi:alkanesulfonate monooxygenase SsuD/methylene tetrahydromethanopterin reductase-like flavin-dependent oxidoreductase (luciferase family)
VEFCDGWMPIATRHDVGEKIDGLRKAAADAGRDPESIELTIWQAPRDLEALRLFQSLGATRVVFGLPSVERDIVIEKLDKYRAIADAL